MSPTPGSIRRAASMPGVGKVRRVTELAVTPRTRVDLLRLEDARLGIEQLLAAHDHQIADVRSAVGDIEASLPPVLNAISSIGGASRVAKRETDALRRELDQARAEITELGRQLEALRAGQTQQLEVIRQGDLDVLGQVRPHIETLAWLMQRVETVRFEMLNELRYGRHDGTTTSIEPRVLNAAALEADPLKVNIGAGHIPLDGYVNVDMRELPGIDVIATVDDLPFAPGSVDEIFSSHTLEHFPQEALRRQLLPYWISLLKPGGVLATIAPDVEAMSADYANGETPFEDFREVLYGAQEYEGDSHFTGFTPASFSDLLTEAGMVDPVTVARGRKNGKCKEFEVTARKAE